jgi:hypothetical protein
MRMLGRIATLAPSQVRDVRRGCGASEAAVASNPAIQVATVEAVL